MKSLARLASNSTLRQPVIALLIACRCLLDPLTQQLKQGMIRISRRSRVVNLGRNAIEDVEPLIDLPDRW